MTAQEEVEQVVNQIVKDFNGRLDIFVANSGIPWMQDAVLDGDISHYHKVMTTDLDGVFFCARAAGKHWRRQVSERTTIDGQKLVGFKQGNFIATASIAGHIVNIPMKQAPYNTAKAAVIHLCELKSCMFCTGDSDNKANTPITKADLWLWNGLASLVATVYHLAMLLRR